MNIYDPIESARYVAHLTIGASERKVTIPLLGDTLDGAIADYLHLLSDPSGVITRDLSYEDTNAGRRLYTINAIQSADVLKNINYRTEVQVADA